MITLLTAALAAPSLTAELGPSVKALSVETPVSETVRLGGRATAWNSVFTPQLDGVHLRRASVLGTTSVRTPGRFHLELDAGLGLSSVQQYGADCPNAEEVLGLMLFIGPYGLFPALDCDRAHLQGRAVRATTTASVGLGYDLDDRWSLGVGGRTEGKAADLMFGLTWTPSGARSAG
ncbi:MAG: hypothetical protein H6734_27235 [Alphaproteobacteria bacterium]|nr:hypothetical protein [Alphaproteobacteria bacterium]MCB9673189.1 hypothetical protein [Alphaproteobacteria bacterium]